jgi:hypothetical protein
MMSTAILNLHLEACLEDSIEKLQVTGQIMPLTYEMKKNAKIVIIFTNFLQISNKKFL